MIPATLLAALYVLVLVLFAGRELVAKLPPTLQAPLLASSSGATGVAAIAALYATRGQPAGALEIAAISLAAFAAVAGFVSADRLLGASREEHGR
jgi:hypothetical protein